MPEQEPIRSSSSRETLVLQYFVSSSHFRLRSHNDDPPNKWTECFSYKAEVITEPEKHRIYPDIPVGLWTVNISRTVKFQRKRDSTGHRIITKDDAVFSISPQKLRVQSCSISSLTVEVTATSKQFPSLHMDGVGSLGLNSWNWPVPKVTLDLFDLRKTSSIRKDDNTLKQLPQMTFQLNFSFSSEPEKQASRYLRFMLSVPADSVLVASDGRQFHVHLSILTTGSAEFSAMLQHDTAAKETGVVQINDMSGSVLEAFLVFLYDHTLDPEAVKHCLEELYYAADTYEVEDLRAMCEKLLCISIGRTNAIKRLAFADDRGLVKLKKRALEFVAENKSNI